VGITKANSAITKMQIVHLFGTNSRAGKQSHLRYPVLADPGRKLRPILLSHKNDTLKLRDKAHPGPGRTISKIRSMLPRSGVGSDRAITARMNDNHQTFLSACLFALTAFLYTASSGLAADVPAPSSPITLGSAESFAVLAASAVTNTGDTTIGGNLGISPGTAVTGFPPGVFKGKIYVADAKAMRAQDDVTAAYIAVAAMPCTVDLTGKDLGGLTLTPGVYCFSSTAQLTGKLVLDFQGTTKGFFFQIGSTLTTASSSYVSVKNFGKPGGGRVFWQIGSSATLGTTTRFSGNIMALDSITLDTKVKLCGRALARTGAVTLDADRIVRSCSSCFLSAADEEDSGAFTP
jgi:hypothetical protein